MREGAAVGTAVDVAEVAAPEWPREAELRWCDGQQVLRGRVLRLILWLAEREARINTVAPDSGQLWLTWKGDSRRAISGDIRTPL